MHGRTRLFTLALGLACCLPATAAAAPMPPGVYDVVLSGGTIDIGTLLPPMPFTSGTSFPATIGTDLISQPIGLTVPPTSVSAPGVTGTLAITPTGAGVTIDPTTGNATADATFTASATFSGVVSGICTIGTQAAPITMHLTTADGSPWDSATNEFSMVDKTFALPTPQCSPGVDALLGLVLGDTSAGNNVITLLGTAIRRPDVPAPVNTTNNTTTNTTSEPDTTGTTAEPVTSPLTPGAVTKHCVVPKLVGKKLAAAKKALKKAGCKTGKVRSKKSKKKKGRVIAQGKKAGKKLTAGAKVPLTVSKGQKKARKKQSR